MSPWVQTQFLSVLFIAAIFKFAPASTGSKFLLVLEEDVKNAVKGRGAEFDCSGSLLTVWLKYEALSTFPSHQRSLKPLALKWTPLRLSDNALQQVFHNQNESWYFWKTPESCQHICLGWMTDSFGPVLLPLFPFPNKIRIKIKPSVDWSSHPSSKYFFLHFFKWPSRKENVFFHCCHSHLLFITKQIEGFYWYWYMSDLYKSKSKAEKHFGMWKIQAI